MSTVPNIQQYWELLANNVGCVRLHEALEFSLGGYAFNHRICPLKSFIVIKLKNKKLSLSKCNGEMRMLQINSLHQM